MRHFFNKYLEHIFNIYWEVKYGVYIIIDDYIYMDIFIYQSYQWNIYMNKVSKCANYIQSFFILQVQ